MSIPGQHKFYTSSLLTGLLLICLFSTIVAQPERFSFRNLTTEDGLSHNDVRAIVRDSIGYMWFGTSNGLDRFDGREFRVYRHQPNDSTSISDNDIRTLCVGRDGSLWVGTFLGGLNRYDPWTDEFEHYRLDSNNTQASRQVGALFEDRSSALWVGTDNGAYRIDERSRTLAHYRHDPTNSNSLSGNPVAAVIQDHRGTMWFSIRINGLNRLDHDGGFVTRFEHDPRNPSSIPTSWLQTVMYEDRARRLWVGSNAGLLLVEANGSSFKQYLLRQTTSSDVRDNWIKGISESTDGKLYVASWASLRKFDPEEGHFVQTLFPFDTSDSTETIRCLYHDLANHVLWLGTRFRGIYKLNLQRKQFALFKSQADNPNSLSAGTVSSVLQDSRGIIWVGLLAGLNRYDPLTKKFFRYHHEVNNPRSLTADFVTTLYEGRNGKILVGTSYNGFDEVDPVTLEFTHHSKIPLEIPSDDVRAFHEDSDGTLWLGTREDGSPGLLKYNRGTRTTTNYSALNLKSPKNVLALLPENKGNLWIGDQDGLYLFNKRTQSFTVFKNDPEDSSSLSDNRVQSLLQTNEDILWVGTASGLNRFDRETGTFMHYRAADGLASDDIQKIAEDGHGNLWLGTAKGITKVDLVNRVFRNYDLGDFLGGEYEITRSSTGDGVLFFPLGTNGFVAFHPDSIRDNDDNPPVALTDFRIANRSISPRMKGSPLRQAIWLANDMTLSYRDNVISFDFAVLEYANTSKSQYAYKMEGFDHDWTYARTERSATYTNLDPGNYTFRVKATNSDGVWSSKEASIRIFITPPWWKTIWAYVAYVLILGSFLYSIYQVRLNRVRLAHELQMEHLEAAKMHEVDQMKSRFFANISHEFRTPLTLIEGPLRQLKSGAYGGNNEEQYDLMLRNTERLTRLVNQLLDLSRLESGQMKIHAEELDIAGLACGIAAAFESLAKRKGIEFRIDCPREPIIGWFGRDAVEKIVTNLLSNAFKFTAEGGEVRASVSKDAFSPNDPEKKASIIRVSDTGIGIPPEEIDKVFDRFYQVDASQTREQEGTGIGLALTKELVELHHGMISVQSEVGKGTTFTVRLPLGKEHFTEDEFTVDSEPTTQHLAPITPDLPPSPLVTVEPETNGSLPLLLIIEDNADMRRYIRKHLEGNYRLSEAINGEDGVRKAIETIPDLIISDVMMPKMDGFEMCRRLKTDERTSHIPVILLTAKAGIDHKIEGLETGADDYLEKPFSSKELRVRITNLIEKRRRLQEKFGRLTLLKPGEITATSVDEQFLKRSMRVAEAHISDRDFSAKEFAEEMFLSRMQIHRKIKALTGHSLWEFFRIIRLERAAQMLRNRTGNIAEIADQIGYETPSHFAEAFRKHFGVTPSEFVSRHANSV